MLNQLRDSSGARRKSKRLGRGIGSGKGKTCARGGKGQTARSGVALAGFEGGQMPLYRRLPKRGFNSLHDKFFAINFDDLEKLVEKNAIDPNNVTLDALRKAGLVKGKSSLKVKLLGDGELKNKFNIEVDAVSKSAEEILTKAGGKVVLVSKNKK
ncbi:50S ribosomal protein L15 [endosymbiont of Acanthamoeba sp. UWC8]|uniref:50S ribosomal protein L15 n=1 Tax=endosymbiont of Acanthamoeba sp. UWC8 TaxID=86106 RepID=UPI0004D159B5|nr:50S ribosomal protein L15 [endosymbiont of Acanthamoeba sp. UWC8]AIF81714.1 50S ribosomal protein L15 [endosymbiont of Acanthamoeba sp. UWC8]MBA8667754.1 50S ribosomal protein L15 [Holosporaceae bacterium 'Namur']